MAVMFEVGFHPTGHDDRFTILSVVVGVPPHLLGCSELVLLCSKVMNDDEGVRVEGGRCVFLHVAYQNNKLM